MEFEFCNWRNDGATGRLEVPGALRRAGRLKPALGQTGRLAGAVDGLPDSDSQSDTPSLRLSPAALASKSETVTVRRSRSACQGDRDGTGSAQFTAECRSESESVTASRWHADDGRQCAGGPCHGLRVSVSNLNHWLAPSRPGMMTRAPGRAAPAAGVTADGASDSVSLGQAVRGIVRVRLPSGCRAPGPARSAASLSLRLRPTHIWSDGNARVTETRSGWRTSTGSGCFHIIMMASGTGTGRFAPGSARRSRTR